LHLLAFGHLRSYGVNWRTWQQMTNCAQSWWSGVKYWKLKATYMYIICVGGRSETWSFYLVLYFLEMPSERENAQCTLPFIVVQHSTIPLRCSIRMKKTHWKTKGILNVKCK
jgi:hypothetical protein